MSCVLEVRLLGLWYVCFLELERSVVLCVCSCAGLVQRVLLSLCMLLRHFLWFAQYVCWGLLLTYCVVNPRVDAI